MDTSTPLPTQPLYVLKVGQSTDDNELVIVAPKTWDVVRRTPLAIAAPWNFSRDPQGRIWIGDGAEPGVDRLVQVFAPDGHLLKTFDACDDTYNTIHFAAEHAFIPCLENGFHAATVVVDLQTLTIGKKVYVSIPNDFFTLLASGGNKDYFILVGGSKENHSIVALDTHTLALNTPFPIPYSNQFTLLTYKERILLLNANPNPATKERQDLISIDIMKAPTVSTKQMAAPGALWGALEGDNLYTYHNLEELGMRSDPTRSISRLNLITGETKLWPLPDRWNAKDIALVNGEIILAHSEPQVERRGLYRFDPTTGKLTLLINLPGAQRILSTAP